METNIITKIDFFDFMRAFFCDDAKYQKLTQSAKKPHIFMFRRMMSIMYPVQMHAICMLDDIRLIDILHSKFCSTTYPQWMYTSGQSQKTDKTPNQIITKTDRGVIDAFMELYGFEYKSLFFLEEMYPKELQKEFDNIEKDIYPELTKEKVKKSKNVI